MIKPIVIVIVFISSLFFNGLHSQEILVLKSTKAGKLVCFDPTKEVTVYYEDVDEIHRIRGFYAVIDDMNIKIVTNDHGAMTIPLSKITQISNSDRIDYPFLGLYSEEELSPYKERLKNSITLGILGESSLFSLHYDRLFKINDKILLNGKIGIGYNEELVFCIWGPCKPDKYMTIPHHFTINIGNGNNLFRGANHLFEIGLGGTLIAGNIDHHYVLYPKIGYRFSPVHSNKFTFRMYANMPVSKVQWENFMLWDGIIFSPFGISLGRLF